MNWDALGAIAELLGALAVFITVVYLTIQVRQSAKAQEQQNALTSAVIMQSRPDTGMSFMNVITKDDTNLKVIAKYTENPEELDLDSMPQAERLRVRYLATCARALFENLFEQYRQGFLSADFYLGSAIRNILMWGNLWLALETPMSFEFEAEVKRILAENSG